MKTTNSVFSGIFFACLIIMASCDETEKESDTDPCKLTQLINDTLDARPSNAEELENALDSIQHYVDSSCYYYREISKKPSPLVFYNDSILRSYTIESEDLLGVLGMEGDQCVTRYNKCRVYLGLASNQTFKLYMTPVDNETGKDVILYYRTRGKTKPFVYDLNAPCPSTCDTESQLYRVCRSK